MVNVPEHRFTEGQIAKLIELLGTHPADLTPMLREELLNPARWFTRELDYQNYPPHSQIDKQLERIESAARRLQLNLSNQLAPPYMRMASGDTVKDDLTLDTAVTAVENLKRWAQEARKIVKRNEETERREQAEREAIGEAIAEANARGERKATPEAIARARAKANAACIVKRRTRGKPRGRAKRRAMRVLVHRLALLWLHTHGNRPKVSVNRDGSTGGKFIRFALRYIEAMREQTTSDHREFAKTVDKELTVTADKIAWHLGFFTNRLLRPR